MNQNIILEIIENDFKVGLLHNEVFVDIPGCETEDKWCDYNKFLSLFSPNVTSCDFSKICDIDISNPTHGDTMEVEYNTLPDDRYWQISSTLVIDKVPCYRTLILCSVFSTLIFIQ